MKLDCTQNALGTLDKLPAPILVANLNHPSLHAKKFSEAEDKWQARVNRSWRFYFRIVGDTYVVTGVIRHPK